MTASTLIRTVNSADRAANLWRSGDITAIAAQERIYDLGFYAVDVGERHIVAWLNGLRFELPGEQALLPC